MKYVPPIGGAEDDSYVDASPASGIEGSPVPAAAIEHAMREVVHVITAAGLTPDEEDLTQLYEAINDMIEDSVPDLTALLEHLTDTDDPHETIDTLDARILYDHDWIGGGAMTPSATNGATLETVETTTNGLTRALLTFPADADASAGFEYAMPGNWDAGTLKARIHWTADSGNAGDDVTFTLATRAFGDDDVLDAAMGTAVTITDDLIAAGDLHISPASAAMTVGGTPAAGVLVHFRLTRDVDAGSSPLAEDVRLLGVEIEYQTSGSVAAWT